jgi:hypothetical protein
MITSLRSKNNYFDIKENIDHYSQSSEHRRNTSAASLSSFNSMISSEYSVNNLDNSGKSMSDNDVDEEEDDDQQSEVSMEFDLDNKIISPITSTTCSADIGMHYYEYYE